MFQRIMVSMLVCLMLLAFSVSARQALANTEPPGYSMTVVRATPHFGIVRVTHTTADMQPSVQCPSGYKVVGGGFNGSQYALVYHNFKLKNGWQVKAKPYMTPWPSMTVFATCLQWARPITVHKSSITINSLQTDIHTASCGANEVPLGGGYKMNDSRALIYTSAPNTNAWVARARNQAGDPKTLTVLAICGPSLYLNQNIVQHVVTVPAGSNKSSKQVCPHPIYSVMSGGFDAQNAYWRISSYPADDDHWLVTVRNDHRPDKITYTIFANCFEFA